MQRREQTRTSCARVASAIAVAVAFAGCGPEDPDASPSRAAPSAAAESAAPQAAGAPAGPAEREALFGDLHVHTKLSFDAYIFGTRADPDAAYRFAKGEAIDHPSGFRMQLREPLDFQAVTDHAMYLGMLPEMDDPDTRAGKHPIAQGIRAARTAAARIAAFQKMFPYLRGQVEDDLLDLDVVRSAWQEVVEAAQRHDDPGRFTSFVAYEYTSSGPARENLHRNVIFQGASAPALPFSSIDSTNPEELWDWMDRLREEGVESLAIPHNSNGSDGMMFEKTDWNDRPIDAAYATQRLRNEPLVEITQVKGTSDTHPMLSPNDEWADFELMEYKIATTDPSRPQGSYVREALRNGLVMQDTLGVNPYRFGLVGASDTHVGAGSFDESNYWSKVGIVDGTPQLRGSVPMDEPGPNGERYVPGGYFQVWSASGLTGVWAEQNTRASIYAALRRQEAFATSGPRIRVRFFGGHGWDASLAEAADAVARAYATGVPMGGDLGPGGGVPSFLVWALRDPHSAPLQRLQVIKGWVEDGETREQVYDVACSDRLAVDAASHRCPDNGATVDVSDCSISRDRGAGELRTVWRDPDFDAGQRAFYYVRVLENPTCRWSTWDAVRAGVEPREGLHPTLQERAWSSPIWYSPGS